jgi:hypothetical protein
MPSNTFHVGLVMAGAVSAGAYSAGVIDFLIEALDEWENAKRNPTGPVPQHQVNLKVISGASAGAITGAIAAGALATRFPPVRDVTIPNRENKLFDSWVDQIDIADLLQDKDLRDSQKPVISLLDSTVLKNIADSALAVEPSGAPRPYVDPEFHLLTTVTNLRGVPYNIPLEGANRIGHGMQLHADYMHFLISQGGTTRAPGALALDWEMRAPHCRQNWEILKDAALASGAFPIGLAPRLLSHTFPADDPYAQRTWPIPGIGKDANGECNCTEAKGIPPYWQPPFQDGESYKYQFQCVDGGVMNNEPLELARQILAGPGNRLRRDPDKADRAVLLIDPFPSLGSFARNYTEAPDLLHIILAMFGALKNQARFKPDEIELAQDPNVFSRFLIAPVREGLAVGEQELAIACGTLGGFGGFLAREFRAHDFMLGRRNCQQFLRRHFVLGETNDLFSDWNPLLKDKYRIERGGKRLLPVIPLVGSCEPEVREPKWPEYPEERLAVLRDRLDQRLGKVIDGVVSQYFHMKFFLVRWLAGLVIQRKRSDMLEFAMATVGEDLRRFRLLRSS